ncbi:hypothetical protein [Stutzerimonas nitrititolerans]|uniref:hypothetical protein n=1 Tax=Stutzerimonas nitrititolerans TaxID=2482751 RepID=UPI0028AC9912|nr:hypothetical protein [Stutzerimonas nitrititolerans]
MFLLQGCSESNVDTVREAKYEGRKHKIGVLLDSRKECDDQKWESMTDASDNVVVTVLCTFELPDALMERALASEQAAVTSRKESLLDSYFSMRRLVEEWYQHAIPEPDRLKGKYKQAIAAKQRELEDEKAGLEKALASDEPEYVVTSYVNGVEYLQKELEQIQWGAQNNITEAQAKVALVKSQLDYLINIEDKAKSAADEYASSRLSAYENEVKKNTKVTNLVAFELLESGPKLAAYKTVSKAEFATNQELLDNSVPHNQAGALGLALGLRSDSDAAVAAYFTQEAQSLSPAFTGQVRPEPFLCSSANDGVELCVFK